MRSIRKWDGVECTIPATVRTPDEQPVCVKSLKEYVPLKENDYWCAEQGKTQ